MIFMIICVVIIFSVGMAIIKGILKGTTGQVKKYKANVQDDTRTKAIIDAMDPNHENRDSQAYQEFEKQSQDNQNKYNVWVVVTVVVVAIFVILFFIGVGK